MRHHDCRWREAVAESIRVVRSKRLLKHANVVIISGLELIAIHFMSCLSFKPYWAWDTIFSVLRLITRPLAFVLNGMHMDIPLLINTPLHEVTLVLEKARLDLSILLWWCTLIFSSVSRIVCILWSFYSAKREAVLSLGLTGDLWDVLSIIFA